VVEAYDGEASGAERAVDLVDGLLRTRSVVQDARGVDHVECAIGEGKHLDVCRPPHVRS